MFIIVFHDYNYVKKKDIETAFSLPGENYIFSVEKGLDLNKAEGICFYNKDREVESFKINHLELIDISTSSSTSPYIFSVFDHSSGTIKKIEKRRGNIEYILPDAIIDIIRASKFSAWDDYLNMLKIEGYISEINDLKGQLKIEREKNIELEQTINSLKK